MIFHVKTEESGTRLDKFLSIKCEDISRSRLKALILEGTVTLDEEICSDPSQKVREGNVLTVTVPAPVDDRPKPEDIRLDIVYEDEALLVINKAAGMVVHPAAGHATGTLVNALLYHCGKSLSGIGGVRRPGIVHRLDKDTSGLMLVAKTDKAHQMLSAQLADRSLGRRYQAVVWRVPRRQKGTIDQPVGRHPGNRLKMAVNRHNGREALTRYTMREAYGEAASLLECKLESGRTHQIRVHMDYSNHPLIGDPLYGLQKTAAQALLKKGGYDEKAVGEILSFPRQALHAREISFIHPLTQQKMTFESPRPQDMEDLINSLKSTG